MSARTGVMLAKPLTPSLLAEMPTWVIVQAKLDGDRCRAVPYLDGGYTLYSSQGTIRNFAVPHIAARLSALARELWGSSHIENWRTFDGELYIHGISHQAIRSVVSRTANLHPDSDKLEFHVFDFISDAQQLKRTKWLMDLGPAIGPWDSVRVVPTFKVPNTMEDIQSAMRQFLDAGYEGVIVRDPLAPYEPKRSSHLLKLKPDKHGEAQCLDFIEAVSLDGDPKGMLGAFLVHCELAGEKKIFRVGAGKLSHAQRTALWHSDVEPATCTIKFRYLALTNAGYPREPVCTRVEVR